MACVGSLSARRISRRSESVRRARRCAHRHFRRRNGTPRQDHHASARRPDRGADDSWSATRANTWGNAPAAGHWPRVRGPERAPRRTENDRPRCADACAVLGGHRHPARRRSRSGFDRIHQIRRPGFRQMQVKIAEENAMTLDQLELPQIDWYESPAPSPTALRPLSSQERLPLVDALRGFAILGVLVAYTLWNLGSPPAE